MLTADDFKEHVSTWTQNFRKDYATALSDVALYAPVAWYQAAYHFVHDVKNSASLSTDGKLQRLLPVIQKCNEQLSSLATDQKMLKESDCAQLAAMLSQPFAIEDLQSALAPMLAGSPKPSVGPFAQKLLATPLPWDSFSRARAQSAERYGYVFVSADHTLPLSDLEAHDRSTDSILRKLGAFSVVRKLEPRASSAPIAKGKPDTLVLDCHQLAALPKATPIPAPWKVLAGSP